MTTITFNKSRVSYQDLAMAYLLKGAGAVGQLVADVASPATALDKTIEAIKGLDASRDVSDLETMRDRFQAATGTGQGRGRRALEVGDTREYSAQQVKDSDLFIRLPVSLLTDEKGAKIKVVAEEGRLVVTVA